MMGLHKLTAGDGYLYLIRQVAAADATDRGRPSLADYYSDKGEAPGRWIGRGLPALGHPQARDPDDPHDTRPVRGPARLTRRRRPDESPLR